MSAKISQFCYAIVKSTLLAQKNKCCELLQNFALSLDKEFELMPIRPLFFSEAAPTFATTLGKLGF